MQEIESDIYYENSYPGVTLGVLILPLGTLLIDAPLRAEDARTWRSAINGLGGNAKKLLVNIDSHTDRTLGARALECTIIAHQKTAQVFRTRPSIFKGQNAESGSEWETQNESVGTRWAVPDITFSQNVSLHWGEPDVILEHHPGPAAGALWVVIPDKKVVFVGDAVLANQPAFLANADIPTWLEALDVLASSYSGYVIISGRGGPVAAVEIRRQQEHLRHIQAELQNLAGQNASVEATEMAIPYLMADFKISAKLEEQYTQRLRHGLYQYYIRYYHPAESGDAA